MNRLFGLATATLAGVLAVGGLSPVQASDVVPITVPGTIYGPSTNVSYQFRANGSYAFATRDRLVNDFLGVFSQDGLQQAPVARVSTPEKRYCTVYNLPEGSYIARGLISGVAHVGGDITVTREPSALLSRMRVHDLVINEEEGGLLVRWSPPVAPASCPDARYSGNVDVRVYRKGYLVQEVSAGVYKAGVFVDPLTVGVRYGVRVIYGGDALVGYGTPRIPSLLQFGVPSSTQAGDPFPVDIDLEDRKGRPLDDEPVELYFEPSATAQATGRAAYQAARRTKLKRLHTNRKGHAHTRVTLKRSGRIIATFKASGKHGGVEKVRRIRVTR